jgi:hypothetical protein
VPAGKDQVYRTPNLSALSYRFAVCSNDERLGRRAAALLAGLRAQNDAAPVEHRYTLTAAAGGSGTVDVTRDGYPLALDQSPGDALGWVVWDVNRSAAEASGAHMLFHAGALDAGGKGVLVPGASGSGKSTLVAGLARAGLGYLTDELAALDLTHGQLLPYAKPITLKAGSFDVLPDMNPDAGSGPGTDAGSGAPRWAGAEWQVAVGADTGRSVGRACTPGFVIVPRYDAGAPTRLMPLSDTEAFLSLALHAVNLLPHGAGGSAAVGRLAAQCACYALTMSDLDEACALVLGLVGEAAPAPLEEVGRAR